MFRKLLMGAGTLLVLGAVAVGVTAVSPVAAAPAVPIDHVAAVAHEGRAVKPAGFLNNIFDKSVNLDKFVNLDNLLPKPAAKPGVKPAAKPAGKPGKPGKPAKPARP